MHETMSGDINSLGHQLNRFSERNRHFRDFTLYSLISTIKEVIACFPVYRTYVTDGGAGQRARSPLHHARRSRDAKRRAPGVAGAGLRFHRAAAAQADAAPRRRTSARSARGSSASSSRSPARSPRKGIEDTALYVYNRLVSLNEVGADPTRFGLDPADVHAWMARAAASAGRRRCRRTSTHDTKRGEDVRARLNVLSEIPGAWKDAVAKMARAEPAASRPTSRAALAPERQRRVPALPDAGRRLAVRARARRRGGVRRSDRRLHEKALREAKVHTSWLSPDEAYEAGGRAVRRRDPRSPPGEPFLEAFVPFQARVAELGIYNSLAQLLIKITAPGVPDFYQGTELWDLTSSIPTTGGRSTTRIGAARRWPSADGSDAAADAARRAGADGRVKLFVMTPRARRARGAARASTTAATTCRSRRPAHGASRVFAFAAPARGPESAITCVPRLVGVADAGRRRRRRSAGRLGRHAHRVACRRGSAGRRFATRSPATHRCRSAAPTAGRRSSRVAALFERFPVALLVPSA